MVLIQKTSLLDEVALRTITELVKKVILITRDKAKTTIVKGLIPWVQWLSWRESMKTILPKTFHLTSTICRRLMLVRWVQAKYRENHQDAAVDRSNKRNVWQKRYRVNMTSTCQAKLRQTTILRNLLAKNPTLTSWTLMITTKTKFKYPTVATGT